MASASEIRLVFVKNPLNIAAALALIHKYLRERKITRPVTDFYDDSYVQSLQIANFAATADTP